MYDTNRPYVMLIARHMVLQSSETTLESLFLRICLACRLHACPLIIRYRHVLTRLAHHTV